MTSEGPRILTVPGGTSPGAAAMAFAALHKIHELAEERRSAADGELLPDGQPSEEGSAAGAPAAGRRTVVVLRDPASVARRSLRESAASPSSAFPELPDEVANDPRLLDGVDLVVPTSGSSTGTPHLVGLSVEALTASASATHEALDGPGRWILALPAHHIAGAQVLFRAAVSGTDPFIVDTEDGFDPARLLPAIAGAAADPSVPAYLSLVPVQLRACLEAGDPVVSALARLSAVLVGGSSVDRALIAASRERGIRAVTTYGMTETCGGCVYDARPLPGVSVRSIDVEGPQRLAVAGPLLMTKYLDGTAPFVDEGGVRWLMTGDLGVIAPNGAVEVMGRADDVIVSGGLSIAPAPVRQAVLTTPGVRDAWILGLPDPKWGSVVAAAVVPDAPRRDADAGPAGAVETSPVGTGPSEALSALAASIRDQVGRQLGRAQAPRAVIAVDDLPQLETGKTDPRGVQAAVEARLGTRAAWTR